MTDLLGWYDTHARTLPWRVSPAARKAGTWPDPYRVWLSEVMLQQTTVAAVRDYFLKFTQKWPDVHALANEKDEAVMAAWAGLGYYARARNLLACARVVSRELGGEFPRDQKGLQALPGIGPYTSAAIAAIAFDEPATVVDGNVERVMARYFAISAPLPTSKKHLAEKAAELTPQERPGDYAQAVMDLGATICTPRNPACGICPWAPTCQGRIQGIAADLPTKKPKVPKPTRYGIAYLAQRTDGAWLLERRPPKGLLGGTLGWPGTEWTENPAAESPPIATDWHDPTLEVRHTFTHFHLQMSLRLARVPMSVRPPDQGQFVAKEAFEADHLPSLMAKAFRLAQGWDGYDNR